MNLRAYYFLRLVVSLLLMVGSVHIAVISESNTEQCLKNNPETEVLIPAVPENAMGSVITNRQAQFKSYNGFPHDALIFDSPPINSIRASAFFFFRFNHRLSQSVNPKAVTIRAPPAARL